MNFFDGGACNGDELGQLTLDLEEANCLNNFAYNATGVIVNTTNPGGQAIAFYQTSDCDKEYQVALSNTPFCVGTIYGSFKVVNSYDDSSGTDLNAAVSHPKAYCEKELMVCLVLPGQLWRHTNCAGCNAIYDSYHPYILT